MKKEKTILYGGISNTPEERAEILYNHPDNDRKEKIIERHIVEYIPISNFDPIPNVVQSNLGMMPVDYMETPQTMYSRDLKQERRDRVNEIRVKQRTNTSQIQKNLKDRMDYINKPQRESIFNPNTTEIKELSFGKSLKKEKNYEKIAEMFYPEMKEESQIKAEKKNKTPLYESIEIIGDKPLTIADFEYIPPAFEGNFTGGAANVQDNNIEYINKLKNLVQSESDKKFLDYLSFILGIEKGYNNHYADKPTNLGVTQGIYNIYRKDNNLAKESVKNIKIQDAIKIYYKYFWKPSKAETLEHPLDLVYFDMYVNSNPRETKDLLLRSDNDVYKFIENRRKFYINTIKAKPEKAAFENGWNNRLDRLKKYVDIYYSYQD